MNTKVLFTASLIAVFTMGFFADNTVAFAQYMGNVGGEGQTGTYTLEEALALQRARVIAAEENPATGSGTPYMSADGIFGAVAITAAVFGGVAGALFIKSKSGKYAAIGRG
jgi:hypothetical protein